MAAEETVRLDKWLWAARFFKTRSMAAKAVNGGHVHVNGNRAKPARMVQVGDGLHIRRGATEFDVVVQALHSRRGPAVEARSLYRETEESLRRREQEAQKRHIEAHSGAAPSRRPDKRDRKKIRKFILKD